MSTETGLKVTRKGTVHAADPGRVARLAEMIAQRELSPMTLLETYLARIDAVDGEVKAWRELDREHALEVARIRDREAEDGTLRGPLHGIPIGVKDVIDVAGLPTRCGSPVRHAAPAAVADAMIVLQLRAQGAVIVGKLHTTEFACFDPAPTTNPWNARHTAGGSSAGSAAAVAAGMVPLALGTQTIASVNRPAAYCGIAAFKPSSGALSAHGVAPLAPAYDTVGFFGGTVRDAVDAFEAVMPARLRSQSPPTGDAALRIVVPDDPLIADMTPDVRHARESMADCASAAGHHVERRRSPVAFERILDLQRATAFFEAGRIYRDLLDCPDGQIGQRLLGAIREGLAITPEQHFENRRELDDVCARFLHVNRDADAFLWPAAPDAAPKGLETTGDPRYIAPWTAIGGPLVTIPAGVGANRLPHACMLAGHPGRDHDMATYARRFAADCEVSPFPT